MEIGFRSSAVPKCRGSAARIKPSPASVGTGSTMRLALVASHDADDHPLHLHVAGIEQQRLHRRIGGLKPNSSILAIELLQRDIASTDESDDHLSVVSALPIFNDHEIAVANLLVDHRI